MNDWRISFAHQFVGGGGGRLVCRKVYRVQHITEKLIRLRREKAKGAVLNPLEPHLVSEALLHSERYRLNRDGPRFSGDIDIFQDSEQRLEAAAEADAKALLEAGLTFSWKKTQSGKRDAELDCPGDAQPTGHVTRGIAV